jgi:hypothetical protein
MDMTDDVSGANNGTTISHMFFGQVYRVRAMAQVPNFVVEYSAMSGLPRNEAERRIACFQLFATIVQIKALYAIMHILSEIEYQALANHVYAAVFPAQVRCQRD